MVYFDGRFIPDPEPEKPRFRWPFLVASILAALVAGYWLIGCSLNTRPIGSKDTAVEVARANAEAEKARSAASVEMMKALVAALQRLGVPAPSPVPGPLCVSTDGVTIVPCQEVIR